MGGFKNALNKIANDFELQNYNQFNWFNVMYKMTEEKNLHSRFIAFLLNPDPYDGSHGQGDVFLKLFFKEFEIVDFELEGVKVKPDEKFKKEEDNIDILITNAKGQAIIIENKIWAGDSNKDLINEEGAAAYSYQIPRYYDKMRSRGFIVSHIFYLTVKSNKPSFYNDFPQEVKDILYFKDYIKSILDWIGSCIETYTKNDVFRSGLIQYKQATTEFLNDYRLALKLKAISAEYLDESREFWNNDNVGVGQEYSVIKGQYQHVKWHVIHEFYTKLKECIESSFKVAVSEINNEYITGLTHRNSRDRGALLFEFNDQNFYVCNDRNGFSIGRIVDNKQSDDYRELFNEKKYAFFDFNKPEVYSLIHPENIQILVGEILEELEAFLNMQAVVDK